VIADYAGHRHRRRSLGGQSRKRYCRDNLGAGDLEAMMNGTKRAVAMDDHRSSPVDKADIRTHPSQRLDDALHRPAAERFVTDEPGDARA
jgi:hypothetical protein